MAPKDRRHSNPIIGNFYDVNVLFVFMFVCIVYYDLSSDHVVHRHNLYFRKTEEAEDKQLNNHLACYYLG